MWNAIILLIRKAFLKNQLKKEERKSSTAELKKKVSKKIKKIKFKIFGINVSLTFVVISAIISFILFAMMLFALLSFMGAISGNTILGWKDDEVQEEDPEKNWVFDNPNIYDPDTGELNISGGIYPKDPILKNRAMLRQIFIRTAKDSTASYGFTILPEYLFGIQIRETGGTQLFNAVDLNKDISWVTSRLNYNASKPICGKSKNGCSYLRKGKSHFVGGTVDSNLNDLGDPYTQKINKDKTLYNQSKQWDVELGINLSKGKSIGHAFGAFQWEIAYLDSKEALFKNFPVQEEFGIDESSLPFASTRPNGYFYIPDNIYSQGWIASSYGLGSSGYNKVIKSSNFQKLDDRNQAFIRFIMSQRYYAGGWSDGVMINDINALISLVENNKVTHLDEMLDDYPKKSAFWNSSTYMGSNSGFSGTLQQYIIDKYSLSLKSVYGVSATSSNTGIWPGVLAACAGKIVWNAMSADIEAAEKEQIVTGGGNTAGNWIDYVGSGKFKPIGDGKYYSNKMQATIFHQPGGSYYATHKCSFCEKSWGGLRPNNTGIMAGAGCGVYSTAFCITNLTGTLVTVEDIYNKGLIRSLALPNDNVCKIAQAYGLESELKLVPNSDEQFKNEVLEVLNSGGMVLSVWRSASKLGEPKSSFAWYSGDNGHFMVIRGYNKTNGKFRVFTSCGANGKTLEDTGIIELDSSVVRKYLSTSSGRYYETIKLKGGVSGGQTSSGVTGPVSGTFNWNLNNADGTINKAEVDKLQKEITASIGNPKVGWKLYAQGSFSSANANKYFKWSLNHLETLQCTWYAFGRAMEYLNEVKGYNFTWETLSPYLSGNGGHYYAQNKASGGFAYGSVPKQNSLVCYKYANSKNDSGHIAYVEVVDEVNKTYRMSECGSGKGWGGITRERKFNENYGEEILQGFIYLDEPLKAGK